MESSEQEVRAEQPGGMDEVDQATWDALVRPGMGLLSYDFLQPCQPCLPCFQFRPLLLAGELACPAFIHRVDARPFAPPQLARMAKYVATTVMEVGNATAPSAPFLSTSRSAHHLTCLWQHFLASPASLLILRDTIAGAPLEEAAIQFGFHRISERPTFVLPLPFGSMGEYLAALRASYRRRSREILGRDLQVRLEFDFAHRASSMARLFAANAARANESRNEVIDARMLRAWSRMPRTAALIVADGQDEAIALILQDAPVLHFLRCGFDDQKARRSGLYMRLLLELIGTTIESDCDILDLGVTCADPKLRLGAQPTSLRVWARHRNRHINRLLQRHAARLAPPETPHRRVFREPPPVVEPSWLRAWP